MALKELEHSFRGQNSLDSKIASWLGMSTGGRGHIQQAPAGETGTTFYSHVVSHTVEGMKRCARAQVFLVLTQRNNQKQRSLNKNVSEYYL